MNMTAASRISSHRGYKTLTFREQIEKARRLTRAEREVFWRDCDAPPNVRRRKREARAWLDLLTVVSSNPGCSERRPDDGWLTIAEKKEIWDRAHDRLRQRDRELFRAVERVDWEESVRYEGLTLAEWHVMVARPWPARKRLRAALRREVPGPLPLTWEQISAVLGLSTEDSSRRPRQMACQPKLSTR
jgi:hypothetical protein